MGEAPEYGRPSEYGPASQAPPGTPIPQQPPVPQQPVTFPQAPTYQPPPTWPQPSTEPVQIPPPAQVPPPAHVPPPDQVSAPEAPPVEGPTVKIKPSQAPPSPWYLPEQPAPPPQYGQQTPTPSYGPAQQPVAATPAVVPWAEPVEQAAQPATSPANHWPDRPADPFVAGGPRIVPTPKPPRSRLLPGILLGALAGLLLFAPAGYLLRFATAPASVAPTPTPTPTTAPTSTDSALSAFQRNQLALNQHKVSGDLATFARSWLPYVSGCATNADTGGPKLGDGERTRVICHYGSVAAYFVEFLSLADRDRALGRRKAMNADAKQMLPGVAELRQQKSSSGNTNGNYVEYGFQSNGHTYAGLWWDDRDTPIGGFLVADWHEGLSDDWEPMRDLWQRYG